MVRCGIIVAGLALVGANLCGCNSEAMPQVSVVNVELKEWVKPEDGKTYLVAMPTWKVEGDLPVAEVSGAGKLTGPSGSVDFATEDWPLYRAAQLDPGTTFNPTNLPEDGIVVGPKEEVLAKTGENPTVEVYLFGSSQQTPEDQLKKRDVPP